MAKIGTIVSGNAVPTAANTEPVTPSRNRDALQNVSKLFVNASPQQNDDQ